ncbi:MAG: sensor histidine kinase [Bryobacteraceae bacterium]
MFGEKWVKERQSALFRALLAAACLAGQTLSHPQASFTGTVFAACFLLFSLTLLALATRIRREKTDKLLLLITDTVLYLGWVSLAAPGAVWLGAAFYCFLLLVAILELGWQHSVTVAGAVTGYHLIVNPPGTELLWPSILATGLMGLVFSFHRAKLLDRARRAEEMTARAREEAAGIRDQERRRVAADLHDGPLQSFISFQVRLEVLRKMLDKNVGAARTELENLQELWRSQISELRTFLRGMRPVEVEADNLDASLRRAVEMFKKDSGIPATFTSDNREARVGPEAAVEVLQVVREALNNAQKHSKASRVAVVVEKPTKALSITVRDDGTGFPFGGAFNLGELDRLGIGPASIKQRVHKLSGELLVDSKPGRGVELKIRIPL